MVIQIEPGRPPEATVRCEFGPAMALHPGGEASTVHCTYIRDAKPRRAPRKLRNLLVATRLLDDFFGADSFPSRHSRRTLPPVRLEYDESGRPRLEMGEFMGMAVSFSHVHDMTWAAIAGPGNHLGMDAARAEEFEGNYPFRRAFHPEELCASMLHVHDIRESAAMLWSVKEAVVKALGTGFGLLGPLDIRIESLENRTDHYLPRVAIADVPLRGLCLQSPPDMNIISFNHTGTWVSAATRAYGKQANGHCELLGMRS